MVPLAPYFFFASVQAALIGSVVVTLLALLVFGYIKGRFTTARPLRSALQTVVVGGLAASAAFVIAKAIGYSLYETTDLHQEGTYHGEQSRSLD